MHGASRPPQASASSATAPAATGGGPTPPERRVHASRSGAASTDGPVRVLLEEGARTTFASAIDWPGWSRKGRGADGALDHLARSGERYRAIAGPGFVPGPLVVVATVPGDATTDFGAPGASWPGEEEPLGRVEAERQVGLLRACWSAFDAAVAVAPAALRKGPRGGGRDRDAVADHVRDAERVYARKAGVRLPPRTPWAEQRDALADALAGGSAGAWSGRYAIRRIAWHVVDHAWEVEDRSR